MKYFESTRRPGRRGSIFIGQGEGRSALQPAYYSSEAAATSLQPNHFPSTVKRTKGQLRPRPASKPQSAQPHSHAA